MTSPSNVAIAIVLLATGCSSRDPIEGAWELASRVEQGSRTFPPRCTGRMTADPVGPFKGYDGVLSRTFVGCGLVLDVGLYRVVGDTLEMRPQFGAPDAMLTTRVYAWEADGDALTLSHEGVEEIWVKEE